MWAQQLLSADRDHQFHDMVGRCSAMQEVVASIQKVAHNLLLLGENGKGKKLVARVHHRATLRADKVFLSTDMEAHSESLCESELCGHVKGLFTEIKDERAGRFEVAHSGLLFLDEIDHLSLPLQAELLAVLSSAR